MLKKKTTLCNYTGKKLSVLSAKLGKQQNFLYLGKMKIEEEKNLCILKAKKRP